MKINVHLEYVWLDGNYPQQVRSKTKIVKKEVEFNSNWRELFLMDWKKDLSKLSIWNYDGSSTNQADTSKSELLLKPVNVFIDPFKENGFLVLSEVYNIDMTPHETNKRAVLQQTVNEMDQETMYGWEQEYIIYDSKTNKPLGWPTEGFPSPQGNYYCAAGNNHVAGRDFVFEHATLCEKMGLEISGINAEVMLGQWEYQIGPVYAMDGADQLWISRYVLDRLTEKYGYYIEYHPKPYRGNDWNGSGMHINFSTKSMREDLKNKKHHVTEACKKIGKLVDEHIEVYGVDNHLRLTGSNETCSITQFKYAVGDRTASIRIPSSVNDETTPGYLEDRRPASNGDPYQIAERMIRTICSEVSETEMA